MATPKLSEERRRELLALLPATRDEVAVGLGVHPMTAWHYLNVLTQEKVIYYIRIGRRVLYERRTP